MMQTFSNLGSMASGGDAGNDTIPTKDTKKTSKKDAKFGRPIPVRKNDWSEDQTSSGVSAQEASEYGMRNVNHRGAQSHEPEMTEIQRLELEIQRLRTGEAASSGAVSSASYRSHPLDDVDTAQLSSEFTQRVLPVASKFRKPTQFGMDPRNYKMDFLAEHQTQEALKALNEHEGLKDKSGTWWKNCFPANGEPMSYYSPFPGQSANLGACDLHFASKPSSLSLNYTLPMADMKHSEFVNTFRNKPGQDGTVKLTIPLSKIRGLIAADLSRINIDETPYHLHVYDIAITEENSNFPIEFDKVFTSSSAVTEGMMNSWSTPRGVDATAFNLVNGPNSEDSHRYYNRILPDGASNIRRNHAPDPLYIGEVCKNGGEFPRWINRNWKEIKHDLAKMQRGNTYNIELPHVEKYKDFTFIQWFIFWYMKEIHRRTVESGEEPDQKPGSKDVVAFNQLYSKDETSTSTHTLISKRVLDAMLKEKQALFDQEKHLMRLEKTQLILWPVQGSKGWDAYERIAEHNEKILSKVGERVRFSCEVTVTFEPFRQAMMLPGAGASSSSSSSDSGWSAASPSRSKTHDAISNSFNSATS